ncbi:MAG: ABC transporter substrate-binding protein [Proteobacteria bacterium]|nr:ABC transporter substrate-binding protein [Pseudomonadota bacterium]
MKLKGKAISLIIPIFVVSLFLGSSPVAGETGVTADSILVGCSNSFSGPLVYPGTELVNYGLEIYFKHINDQGGINGRMVKTQYYDDAYSPQKAVANTIRLVEQDGVFAILASQGTAPVFATIKYLGEQKVPLLFPFQGVPYEGVAAIDTALGGKYIFTSFTSYPLQTEIVMKWLVQKKNFKRIGMIYQDDKYGYSFRDPAKKLLGDMGLDLTAAEPISRKAIDASAQVAKLKAANLDAVLLVLTPRPGGMFLKQAHKVGWTESKLISSGPLTDEKFIILAGGVGESVWGLSLWPDPVNSKMPGVVEYREILEKYAPGHVPNRFSLYGYFYAKLFSEAARRTGKDLTRENLVKTLEKMKRWKSGIMSPVSFSPDDHKTQQDGFMAEVEGGVFKPISGWLSIKDGKLKERRYKE